MSSYCFSRSHTFFCVQEPKPQEGQIDLQYPGYESYWDYAEKKGYSGTAIFTRHKPLSVARGLGIDAHDHEGRAVTLEFEQIYHVTAYVPNSQDGQRRQHNPNFTDEEREKFSLLLEAGFTDTFRYFYPDKEEIYSWWSYRFKAREKNAGWRIDYFLASNRLQPQLQSAAIHTEIFGSDHCPVEVNIDL